MGTKKERKKKQYNSTSNGAHFAPPNPNQDSNSIYKYISAENLSLHKRYNAKQKVPCMLRNTYT